MRDRATLPTVLLQLDNPDRARHDARRLRHAIPRSLRRGCRLDVVCPGEMVRSLNRLVRATVAHHQDLPPTVRICLPSARLQGGVIAAFARCAVVPVLCFEILDCFLQHAGKAVVFVVSRHDQRDEYLGVRYLVCFLGRDLLLPCHFLESDVIVMPAGKRLGLGRCAIGEDGCVLLFGLPRWSGGRC